MPEPDPQSARFDQRYQAVNKQTNVAGDYVVGDEAYNVVGKSNPFLGLRAFTYDERAMYAGRDEDIEAALRLLTEPGAERTLLFITGASGSGKSSFAQAGLLPALEQDYTKRRLTVQWAVFRPSRHPLAGLSQALSALGLSHSGPFADVPQATSGSSTDSAGDDQISLLVIDQFEEFFTQSNAEERDKLFTLLASLPPFSELRMHVVATVRADYLPELFDRKRLYDIAKHGIDLRVMQPQQLIAAIQRPVQAAHPNDGIGFEPALLEKLAEDAAGDASYLPLLQVTLEDLWDGGLLTLERYSGLAEAISRRAEQILAETTDESGRTVPRSELEQAAIMTLFLDLVDVSLDDDARRDVRKSRPVSALMGEQTGKRVVIDELSSRRLLAARTEAAEEDPEHKVEWVDIIHESLIINWNRLNQAIQDQRTVLQQRARFENALDEWEDNDRDDAYLLTGIHLTAARELRELHDVALRAKEAREFLAQSIAQAERHQRRNRQITIAVIASLSILLVVAAGLGLWALDRQQAANRQADAAARAQAEAEHQADVAQTAEASAEFQADLAAKRAVQAEESQAVAEAERSRAEAQLAISRAAEVAAVSRNLLASGDPVAATGFAAIALKRLAQAPQTQEIFWEALHGHRRIATLSGHDEAVTGIQFSPDGELLATASRDDTAAVWNLRTGDNVLTVEEHTDDITGAVFGADGQYLITGSRDGTAMVHRIADGQLMHTFVTDDPSGIRSIGTHANGRWFVTRSGNKLHLLDIVTGEPVGDSPYEVANGSAIRVVTFTRDGSNLLAGADDTQTHIWNIESGGSATLTTDGGHQEAVDGVQQSPDARFIVSKSSGLIILWEWVENKFEAYRSPPPGGRADYATQPEFSHDSKFMIVGTSSGDVLIWDLDNPQDPPRVIATHSQDLIGVAFDPTDRLIVSTSRDGESKLTSVRAFNTATLVQAQSGSVSAPVFAPNGVVAATSDDSGSVNLWRVWLGANSDIIPLARVPSEALAYYEGMFLIGGDEGYLQIWTPAENSADSVHISWQNLTAITVDAESETAFVGTESGTIIAYDLGKGTVTGVWQAHRTPIHSLQLDPTTGALISAGHEPTIKFWDVYKHSLNAEFDTVDDVTAIRPTSAQTLLVAHVNGDIDEWNLDSQEGKTIHRAGESILAIAVTADNETIIAALSSPRVQILKRTRLPFVASIPLDAPLDEMVLVDSTHLIGADARGQIVHIDIPNRTRIAYDAHNSSSIRELELVDDTLYSVGDDGFAKAWPTTIEQLLAIACQRIDLAEVEALWDEHFDYQVDTGICDGAYTTFPAEVIAGHQLTIDDSLPSTLPLVYYFESISGTTLDEADTIQVRWKVENANEVYLEIDGELTGRAGTGAESVVVIEDTVLRLVARNEAGEKSRELAIDIR